ncbi:adenylate/guanylate cyclase domain-containing protein [Leptospira bouyouniensis]|uniref:Adenylate/guanylate cyclase domain-containing protein n=2 Tax=Leptospira bouyouniensis TaxID=2484911 RepID=A0ABY2L343_9LEPT|nr:adenylate/guanylate cyclase domain-containing protein [Leptospira bouyouniensis]
MKPMAPKQKFQFLAFLLIYFIVPFSACLFTLIFANYTSTAFLPEKFLVLFEATRVTQDFTLFALTWAPFPIITIILFFYSLPVADYLFKKEKCSYLSEEKARHRIVHSPIIISLYGFVGWELSTFLSVFRIDTLYPEAPPQSILTVTILFAFWGLFAFAFSYATTNYLNKTLIIPCVFPEGGLGKYAKGKQFSIVTKQIIFWTASTLFPIVLLIFGLLLRTNQNLFDLHLLIHTDVLFEVIAIMLFFSFVFSVTFAISIQHPLNKIEDATELIKEQKFDTRVTIFSSDELGLLGDAVNEMAEGLAERERIKDTFGRIVDPRVRDYLLSNEHSLGGKVVDATILFSDLRDFTKLSEKRTPEEVLYILNRYFQEMSNAIEIHGGFINKFIGDAILAVFGTPMPMLDHADRAFQTALQMQKNLDLLNKQFLGEGLTELKMGIGIHTGSLLVGNIGSANRMEFTVIGDTVNTASRVEGLCKGLQKNLLITENTANLLADSIRDQLQSEGEYELKGRESKEKIYSYPIS